MKVLLLLLFAISCVTLAAKINPIDKKKLRHHVEDDSAENEVDKVSRESSSEEDLDVILSAESSDEDGIVNGDPVSITAAPYQVQLQLNGFTICGGSIIDHLWILTAAHCLVGQKGRFRVLTGSQLRGRGESHEVASILVHKGYNKKTNEHDIALLKLSKKIKYDDTQRSISLSTSIPKPGADVFLTGFGVQSTGGQISQVLEGSVTPVVSTRKCKIGYYFASIRITEGMFCAGNGVTDTCQGDSGGPAVIDDKLAGVVSFGMNCASTFFPGVYTLVAHYIDWIEKNTKLTFDTDIGSKSGDDEDGDYIVQGEVTSIKKAPYQIQLVQDAFTVCGGSIISAKWILTAAHCVFETPKNEFSVLTGSSIRHNGNKHVVKDIIIHQGYNNWTSENDIALIELKSPIKFDERQNKISLATAIPHEGKLYLTGYGAIGTKKSVSKALLSTSTPIVKNDLCGERYAFVENVTITEKMFCAGNGVTDTCQGDSGGPAVIGDKLAGVVSFGMKCADKHYPGVYTSVPKYRQWISKHTSISL